MYTPRHVAMSRFDSPDLRGHGTRGRTHSVSRERRSDPAVAGSDVDMIRLIADLYYVRDLNQPEIAELTRFSVSKVSRLLAQARELGIVRITVEPGPSTEPPLADALSSALGVDVHITPGGDDTPVVAARLCGVAAVDYVMRQLPSDGIVGLAGGYTIEALVSALPRRERPKLTIVPVVGGWDTENRHLDVNETARRMGDRLSASVRYLHAPGMLDSPDTKTALLADSTVRLTTDLWGRLDFALQGVSGGPSAHPGYGTVMDRLEDAGRRRLVDKGVIGDLSGHLFRIDGSFVDDELDARTIAIPIDLLRRTPRVVIVAAGTNKVAAIVGAARTGLIHAIVTDRPTADAALALAAATRPAAPVTPARTGALTGG